VTDSATARASSSASLIFLISARREAAASVSSASFAYQWMSLFCSDEIRRDPEGQDCLAGTRTRLVAASWSP
jgi:hypothetical protein